MLTISNKHKLWTCLYDWKRRYKLGTLTESNKMLEALKSL